MLKVSNTRPRIVAKDHPKKERDALDVDMGADAHREKKSEKQVKIEMRM